MLDERLSLAAQLYQPCALGADIGTDHALLPCYLLTHGICQEMNLADISPKALLHAEESVRRHHLEARAHIRRADGLDALDAPCGCVSMMGMGGETIRSVLLSGAEKLHGAVLVLSSHTEQPLVRRTLPEIGYHIVQERLCQAAGRFYIFWRAEAGLAEGWSAEEAHFGRLLWTQNPPELLADYCRYRIKVMEDRLTGLAAASGDVSPVRGEIAVEIAFYRAKIAEITKSEGATC